MTLRKRIQALIAVDDEIRELLYSEDSVAASIKIGRMLAEFASPKAKAIVVELVARSREGRR
jgi:hypothetical protein